MSYNIYVGICLAMEKEGLGEANIIQMMQEEKSFLINCSKQYFVLDIWISVEMTWFDKLWD